MTPIRARQHIIIYTHYSQEALANVHGNEVWLQAHPWLPMVSNGKVCREGDLKITKQEVAKAKGFVK